jgi:hypothetical protein
LDALRAARGRAVCVGVADRLCAALSRRGVPAATVFADLVDYVRRAAATSGGLADVGRRMALADYAGAQPGSVR